MRAAPAIFSFALALLVACPGSLFAQQAGGAPSWGMFGSRTLGQTLRPAPGQINSAMKFGPSGNFLGTGRFNGPSMFQTPWRPAIAPTPYVYEPLGPFPPAVEAYWTAVPQVGPAEPPMPVPATGPEAAAAGATGVPQGAPETSPAAAAPAEGEQPGASGTEAAPAAVPPAAATAPLNITVRFASTSAAATVAPSPLPYQPSPALSARLTRLARSRGLDTPTGISVSVANGIALLEGVVGTDHARMLLANLVLLEPGIARVDNRLTTAPPGLPPPTFAPR